MALRVSDLSHAQREQIREKVIEQVGRDQYEALAKALGGEDAVLNAVLEQAGGGSPAKEEPNPIIQGCWAGLLPGILFAIGNISEGGWAGAVGGFVAGFITFGPTWAVLAWVFSHLSKVIAVAAGVIVFPGLLYLSWLALVYTAEGTFTWFQWLTGHFQ